MTYGDNPDNSGPIRSRDRRVSEARDIRRTRRDQIARMRTRIAQIRPDTHRLPTVSDFNALLGIVKGIMDIISDDGEDE